MNNTKSKVKKKEKVTLEETTKEDVTEVKTTDKKKGEAASPEKKKPAEKQAKPKLMSIRVEKLHPFKDHPYKIVDDDAMEELKDSISKQGFLNRIIVRPLEDAADEYEVISGHRRVHAAVLLDIKEVPAVVYFIDRDEATLMMVDSNNQRADISPMEKGRAYRMKYEALKHQGKSTSDQVGPKLTVEEISDKDSPSQVKRFMRLTYLINELQEYVENGKMKVYPAVELSFIDEEGQRAVVDRIDETEVFPSHAQTKRMRKLFEEGKLDYDTVSEIMAELKPNQIEKLKIPMAKIREFVPQWCATPKDCLDYIFQLLEEDRVRRSEQEAQKKPRRRDDGPCL